MKVIELLYKLSNNEEVPANIRYDNVNWKYIKDKNDYYSDEWLVDSYLAHCCFEEFADDEVELIKERELPAKFVTYFKNNYDFDKNNELSNDIAEIKQVIDSLIDYLSGKERNE